jgi:hypothetical protein
MPGNLSPQSITRQPSLTSRNTSATGLASRARNRQSLRERMAAQQKACNIHSQGTNDGKTQVFRDVQASLKNGLAEC